MKGSRVAPGRRYLPPLEMGRLSGTMRLMAQYTCLRKGHDAYKMLGFDVCRRCWKITGIRKLLKQCRERYEGFIRLKEGWQ
jgi:hypothetical protein